MNNPMLFDCLALYGPRPNKATEQRWSLAHLLEDLDQYGIAGALVRHEQALVYDCMTANRRLIQEIKPHRQRLWPCWVAAPHQMGDFPAPPELLKEMTAAGVKAIHLYPTRHGYPVHKDFLQPLADALNPRQTVICVDYSEISSSYEAAVNLGRLFRNCPVILARATWGNFRPVVGIMDTCPNVHLEFSLFQANRAVEWMRARYGIERVLLGTGLPVHSGGAARGFIDWSLLPDKEIALFAGGNLKRLLGEGPQRPATLPSAEDPIMLRARSGKALEEAVLDAHCHVLDDGVSGAGTSYTMSQGDAAHMLELARHCGIGLTAFMSWNGPVGMDAEAGNELIAKIVQAAPEEVVGLSTVDPTRQSSEEIKAVCDKYHLGLGFRGLKPYFARNGIHYHEAVYNPYFEFGNRFGLYALLHTDETDVALNGIGELAKRFPAMTFLIAHSGGSWHYAKKVIELGKKCPAVMAELTLTPVLNGIIEYLAANLGADRVLFGTDAPMRDPRPQLAWVINTRLPAAAKRNILGANFARILQKGQLPGHALPGIVTRAASTAAESPR